MSLLVEYFVSADDAEARTAALDGAAFEVVLDGRGINPLAGLDLVEAALGGRTFEQIVGAADGSFSVVAQAGSGALIVVLGAVFEDRLLAAAPELLARAAQEWAAHEELEGADPADLLAFLGALQQVVVAAHATGRHLYCRVAM